MGLDTVELVVRFEDAFGLNISDEVAVQLTSPRKVTDYVMTQVALSNEPACLSQQAFYFLRRTFVPHLQLSRNEFRPDTELGKLFPMEKRKAAWAELRSELGAQVLPELARPFWLASLLTIVSCLVFVYVINHARTEFQLRIPSAFVLGLLAALAFGYLFAILTRPFKHTFRRGQRVVGDLAEYLLINSPHSFKRERGWTREQVAAVVRAIVIDVTFVTDFTEDSHFITDMHLD